MAFFTWSGESALVRTCILAALAHQVMICVKFLYVRLRLAAALFSSRPWTTSDGAVLTSPG